MPHLFKLTEEMTRVPTDEPLSRTYVGQAHVAGTGPAGKTCRECAFFHRWKNVGVWPNYGREPAPPGYYGKKHTEMPLELKPAYCNRPILNKPTRLNPHEAKACRLFEQSDTPWPAVKVDENGA